MKLWDNEFLVEFIAAFANHLKEDDLRWGNTWLERTREGQEDRIKARIEGYFKEYAEQGVPIDWLSIIGNCYIAWLREQHPEIWPK